VVIILSKISTFLLMLVCICLLTIIGSNHGNAEEAMIVTSDYTFTQDIIVTSGHGIFIGADDITIDGNGFILDGTTPGPCTGGIVDHVGIHNVGFDNITIENLEIKNFCSGIYCSLDSNNGNIVYNNLIDNCVVHHNGNADVEWTESHGIKWIGVSDSIIQNCVVYNNEGAGTGCEDGGNGIYSMGTSSGDGGKRNRYTNNEIYGNTKGGLFTKMKPEYCLVDNNTIYENGQGGIILRCKLSNTHTIENNQVTSNFGTGIFIGGEGNIIKNNIISENKNGSLYTGIVGEYGTGVDFGRNDGSNNNTMIDNTICDNEVVDVEAFDTNEVTGNFGTGNTGSTATNYKDDDAADSNNFKYNCSTDIDNGQGTSHIDETNNDSQNTPGFETVILLVAILFFIAYKRFNKKHGENK
jgi:parallel beta-helix repeat protein